MEHSDSNPSESPDPISDDRLDQLLGLAQPQLDRQRQKRLRVSIERMLGRRSGRRLDRRTGLGWSRNVALQSAAAVACCCLAGWLCWNALHDSARIAAENAKATVPGQVAIATNIKTQVGNDIEARSHDTLSHDIDGPRDRKQRSRGFRRVASRNTRPLSDSALQNTFRDLSDTFLLNLAESKVGLALLDQANRTIEEADVWQTRLNSHARSRGSRIESEPERTLTALKQFRRAIENQLVANARNRQPEIALASFRVLCRCGSRDTLSFVLTKWHQPTVRSDIVVAAIRLADSRTLGRLIETTDDRKLQTTMMGQLLCQQDVQAVDRFLQLTDRHGLFAIARNLGRRAKCGRTDVLLNRLQSNRFGIARAAAITLSEIGDSRISERLFEMARWPTTRRAAVLALTARQDPVARQFVARASRDIDWVATVGNAKRKWDRLLAVN